MEKARKGEVEVMRGKNTFIKISLRNKKG